MRIMNHTPEPSTDATIEEAALNARAGVAIRALIAQKRATITYWDAIALDWTDKDQPEMDLTVPLTVAILGLKFREASGDPGAYAWMQNDTSPRWTVTTHTMIRGHRLTTHIAGGDSEARVWTLALESLAANGVPND